MGNFDLKKALAGAPVKLNDGSKAFIKYQLPDELVDKHYPNCNLFGYIMDKNNKAIPYAWNQDGVGQDTRIDDAHIVGMWTEKATITVPVPIQDTPEPNQEYWSVILGGIKKNVWSNLQYELQSLNNGLLFYSEQDAQEFVNAMRGARAQQGK